VDHFCTTSLDEFEQFFLEIIRHVFTLFHVSFLRRFSQQELYFVRHFIEKDCKEFMLVGCTVAAVRC
jgi:hypothetical protein